MNRFQLADFLLKNSEDEGVKEAIEVDENINDFIDKLYGGATKNEAQDVDAEIIDKVADSSTHMEIYKPKFTRNIMSKFEYVGAITSLAIYLKGLKSISKYVEVIDCSTLVNPCELAFYLLEQGKMSVLFIRNRTEKVSYSELYINKAWREEVLKYFHSKNESINKELYKPLSEMIEE